MCIGSEHFALDASDTQCLSAMLHVLRHITALQLLAILPYSSPNDSLSPLVPSLRHFKQLRSLDMLSVMAAEMDSLAAILAALPSLNFLRLNTWQWHSARLTSSLHSIYVSQLEHVSLGYQQLHYLETYQLQAALPRLARSRSFRSDFSTSDRMLIVQNSTCPLYSQTPLFSAAWSTSSFVSVLRSPTSPACSMPPRRLCPPLGSLTLL